MPVPGDIPVFLELALKVCSRQDADHRVRTIVIPDCPSAGIFDLVEKSRPLWTGPLDVALLPRPERWILPRLKSGSRNHGLQLIKGVSASTTSHIVLHDADLFLLDPGLLETQYKDCLQRDLDCLGVSPVWDPWYLAKGLRLAATWEMVASVDWLRRFPPYRHIGHDADLFGERHTFDTTLYAQATTPGSHIDWIDRGADFVHFNYVITTFREFQRRGAGFLDSNFRLLLIALFVHLFSDGPPPKGLPLFTELSPYASGPTDPLRYPYSPDFASRWFDFRTRLDRMLTAEHVPREAAGDVAEVLGVFDRFYLRDDHDRGERSLQ